MIAKPRLHHCLIFVAQYNGILHTFLAHIKLNIILFASQLTNGFEREKFTNEGGGGRLPDFIKPYIFSQKLKRHLYTFF